jgi:hypothetical protein
VDLDTETVVAPAFAQPKPRRRGLWLGFVALAAVIVVIVLVAALTGGSSPSGSAPPAVAHSVKVVPNASAPAPAGPGVTAIPPGGFQVTGGLCSSVDFAPVKTLGGAVSQPAVSNRADKVGYTAYTCASTFTRTGTPLTATVTALVFGDAGAAATSFADAKAHPPTLPLDTVPALGASAFGYQLSGDGARVYQLWFTEKNLELGVRFDAPVSTPPTKGQLHDTGAALLSSTLAKMRP